MADIEWVEEILDDYLWDGVTPHEFFMTLDYIMRRLVLGESVTYIDYSDDAPFKEMPTIKERAINCISSFLYDMDVATSDEDEGIVTIELLRV